MPPTENEGFARADCSSKKRPKGRPTLNNEQLLDIALDLFLEKGFERTTIDAIASSAGMAKRTIYARYPDKEALFKAALRRAIDEWLIPVEHLKELETEDIEETLLRIGKVLVNNILSPAGLGLLRLTNTVSVRMPNIAAANVEQGTEPTLDFLADLLTRRIDLANGADFDARLSGTAFLNLVVGGPASTAAWGISLDQEAIDEQVRHSVRLFLHGLLPRDANCDTKHDENRRLRDMLTDALLEVVALKEKCSCGAEHDS